MELFQYPKCKITVIRNDLIYIRFICRVNKITNITAPYVIVLLNDKFFITL